MARATGAAKFTRPAVLFEGGPRHGWGYYLDDAVAQKRACEATGIDFMYEPTARKVLHPGGEGKVVSDVWAYTGGGAASTVPVVALRIERFAPCTAPHGTTPYARTWLHMRRAGKRGLTITELHARLPKDYQPPHVLGAHLGLLSLAGLVVSCPARRVGPDAHWETVFRRVE